MKNATTLLSSNVTIDGGTIRARWTVRRAVSSFRRDRDYEVREGTVERKESFDVFVFPFPGRDHSDKLDPMPAEVRAEVERLLAELEAEEAAGGEGEPGTDGESDGRKEWKLWKDHLGRWWVEVGGDEEASGPWFTPEAAQEAARALVDEG